MFRVRAHQSIIKYIRRYTSGELIGLVSDNIAHQAEVSIFGGRVAVAAASVAVA